MYSDNEYNCCHQNVETCIHSEDGCRHYVMAVGLYSFDAVQRTRFCSDVARPVLKVFLCSGVFVLIFLRQCKQLGFFWP